MPAVESQKSAEDRQNKENINDCRGFILLQTHLAFSLGSGSKNIILASFKIKRNRLLNDKSFIDKACSVKMTGHSLRSLSPFFHGPRGCQSP